MTCFRSIIISLLTLLALISCGGSDDNPADNVNDTSPSPTISPTPTPISGQFPQPEGCAVHLANERSDDSSGEASYAQFFEAESAIHNLIPKTEAEEGFETGTTSGTALRMEKTGNLSIRWNGMEVKQDGLAEFVIIGASPWGSKFQDAFIYNSEGGVVYSDDNFEMTDSGDNPKVWSEYPIYAELTAGIYDLEIGDDWGFVFFDALKVRDQAVVRNSTLNLKQINYFKNLDNTIELRVAYNNNKLMGMQIDGNPVHFDFGDNCDQVIIDNQYLQILSEGNHVLQAVFDKGEDASANLVVKEVLTRPENQRYEAEFQSTGLGVDIVSGDDSASNSGYIEFSSQGSIEFVVDVPAAGKYELGMNYKASNSDAKRQLFINGVRMRTAVGYRYTEEWDNSAKWILPLNAGVNTITLEPDFGHLALDYLEISSAPLVSNAQIHPKRNTVYLGDALQPLRIKVDPINQSLMSITTSTGETVSFTTEDAIIHEGEHPIQILEGGFWAEISANWLASLEAGQHTLDLNFDDGSTLPFNLEVIAAEDSRVAALTLTFFDVSHGLAVLMQLPNGSNIMVDTGKHDMNEQRVRPFMIANHLPLHEIWTSHRHGDHWGGTDKLLEAYGDIAADKVKHNQSLVEMTDDGCNPAGELPFTRGDVLTFGEASITVQNAHGDHCSGGYLDFNPNSLAFRLEYKGFRFGFQGDIYGQQQDENLAAWGEEAIQVDVLQSNHHWHGSISPDYVKKTSADLIVVSASEHVWGAGSFTQDGMEGVNWLREHNPTFKERLFTFDSGHIVVKVFDDGSWTYETINRQDIHYAEGSADTIMGYARSDLEQIKVGNYRGYAEENRPFPILPLGMDEQR